MTILLFLHLIVAVHCSTQHTVLLQPPPEIADGLRIQPDKHFKIALFADLHFGEDAWTDWGPRQDVNSIKVMSTVLDHETPDFVVYLGDVITANNMAIPNASLYWNQALSPAKSRDIPWASVFGNHDDAPFEWPMEWFSGLGIPPLLCPVANSSDQGYGNRKTISSSEAVLGNIRSIVILRSSNGRYISMMVEEACSFRGTPRLELMKHEIENNELSFSRNGPRDLWPSVSNYVLEVSSSKDQESSAMFLVPEVVFWHIPSKYFKKVAPTFWIHKPCVGSINKERVAAQEAESGIMDILVERTSVKLGSRHIGNIMI
ncbi:inactive purple acid phosphatase 16 isoform X3 [Tripterygium wilfordii]|uniref:Inactive purple acid phosphatase 16 isoform X3 n=1 Tax=Tripterygium wilfordii TaxID=458696 RepID=A0A7J7DV46_TRIWF|nr:inactive purple acid phosphatase 16 isoform X3 [Tripterygium wilfordii]